MAVVVEIPSCMFQGGCRDTLQTRPQQSNFSAVIIAIMVINIVIMIIMITRSYAALRAADLDWIVGPGYSSGRYILEKNHEKP